VPWSLQHRDEGWCVVKDADDSVAGVHPSRADAIKQQRALYANEARVASMYAKLDAMPDPEPQAVVASGNSQLANELAGLLLKEDPLATELVGKMLKEDRERTLIASVAESQSMIARQMFDSHHDRRALVAALERIGQPIVNMPPAEVTVNVPPAEVNFTVPPAEVTVNVPDVHVKVDAPQVTVRPNITVEAPSVQKTVTFERDPLTHEVIKAEVTEG